MNETSELPNLTYDYGGLERLSGTVMEERHAHGRLADAHGAQRVTAAGHLDS